MNERIRQLAEQAGLCDAYMNFDHEYFAQLIVRECARRSQELGQPELGKGLMKHFGVEE